MELKVFRESFSAVGKQWEGKTELPIDTEILIPDYLPQIFKIVKCLFYLVILQKNLSGNRLLLEGYLRCVVLYQPEDGEGLGQTEQKVPFSRTVELPDDTASAGGKITVCGAVEYINCRAVNQRRIEVRGSYALKLRFKGCGEYDLVTSLAACGAEQSCTQITSVQNVINLDKLMTNEETVKLPENLATILDISGNGEVMEKKLLAGKAVLKGSTQVQVMYMAQGQEQMLVLPVSVSFNQIVDIDGLNEESKCTVWAETVGCTLLSGGAEGESSITVTSMLHISVYRKGEYTAVRDAFSTQFETEEEYAELTFEQETDEILCEVPARVQIPLQDDGAREIGCLVTAGPLILRETDGCCKLMGTAEIHLIYKSSLGEYACADAEAEFELPKSYPGMEQQYSLDGWTQVQQVQLRRNGDAFLVEAQIKAGAYLLEQKKQQLLCNINCSEPLQEQDGVALRVYYAKRGENLFDIAKCYHASPKVLMACNQFETESLEADAPVLIPCAT